MLDAGTLPAMTAAAQALCALDITRRSLSFPQSPGVVFYDFYALVTRQVITTLARVDHGFRMPEWVDVLTATFAQRALEATGNVWVLALQPYPAAKPYQYALAGMNAHINYDLARDVLPWIDGNPTSVADYQHDYFHIVPAVLTPVINNCVDLVADQYSCPFTRRMRALPSGRSRMHASLLALITRWRTTVWNNVMALHQAPYKDRDTLQAKMDQHAMALITRIFQ